MAKKAGGRASARALRTHGPVFSAGSRVWAKRILSERKKPAGNRAVEGRIKSVFPGRDIVLHLNRGRKLPLSAASANRLLENYGLSRGEHWRLKDRNVLLFENPEGRCVGVSPLHHTIAPSSGRALRRRQRVSASHIASVEPLDGGSGHRVSFDGLHEPIFYTPEEGERLRELFEVGSMGDLAGRHVLLTVNGRGRTTSITRTSARTKRRFNE